MIVAQMEPDGAVALARFQLYRSFGGIYIEFFLTQEIQPRLPPLPYTSGMPNVGCCCRFLLLKPTTNCFYRCWYNVVAVST